MSKAFRMVLSKFTQYPLTSKFRNLLRIEGNWGAPEPPDPAPDGPIGVWRSVIKDGVASEPRQIGWLRYPDDLSDLKDFDAGWGPKDD